MISTCWQTYIKLLNSTGAIIYQILGSCIRWWSCAASAGAVRAKSGFSVYTRPRHSFQVWKPSGSHKIRRYLMSYLPKRKTLLYLHTVSSYTWESSVSHSVTNGPVRPSGKKGLMLHSTPDQCDIIEVPVFVCIWPCQKDIMKVTRNQIGHPLIINWYVSNLVAWNVVTSKSPL